MENAPLWLQAVVLGLVQGLTEFLPISSSGHLILIPALTGWTYLGKVFDVALHFGTFLAIVNYFDNYLRTLPRKLLLNLVLATVPAALVGFFLDDYVEQLFGGVVSIALLSMIFGLVLGWSDRRGAKNSEMAQLSTAAALTIGCAQVLALVPGVSRCGITMSAGLWVGLTRSEAARFSFLLALPVTGGAFLLRLIKLVLSPDPGWNPPLALACLLGIIAAAGSGSLCIRALLRYLQRKSFWPFVYYRLGLGAILLWWLAR